MPYISVKVAGNLTKKQKEDIVSQITETMLNVANKPKSATYITIEEVEKTNWACNGKLFE